jgi:hypothetical protein
VARAPTLTPELAGTPRTSDPAAAQISCSRFEWPRSNSWVEELTWAHESRPLTQAQVWPTLSV